MSLQIKLLLSKGSNGRSFTRVRVFKAFVVHFILYVYFSECTKGSDSDLGSGQTMETILGIECDTKHYSRHEHQLVHRLHFMFGSETNCSGHAGRTISISYDAIVLPHCEIDKVFVSPFDMSF